LGCLFARLGLLARRARFAQHHAIETAFVSRRDMSSAMRKNRLIEISRRVQQLRAAPGRDSKNRCGATRLA
jgi:hypothetical protein